MLQSIHALALGAVQTTVETPSPFVIRGCHSSFVDAIHGLQKCPRTSFVAIRHSWLLRYSCLGTGGGADDGGDAIHELGAVQHVGVVEHALLERHNDKLVCVGCQKVLEILLHDRVYILTPNTQTLHEWPDSTLVYVGCQKVLNIILHEIVCIFSHPTHKPTMNGPMINW